MGDRALIQLKSGEEVSPVLYLHWGGSGVAEIIEATKQRMAGRHADIEYAFARLVQQAIGTDRHNTGFGVINQSTELTIADSQGDAGCFVVDASTGAWNISAFGGYGLARASAAVEA